MQLFDALVAGTSTAPSGASGYFLLAVVALLLTVALLVLLRKAQTRSRVTEASSALARLEELNIRYGESLRSHSAMSLSFRAKVTSKQKFDRFDLDAFMIASILEREETIGSQVAERRATLQTYFEYQLELNGISQGQLGRSSVEGMSQVKFDGAERRLFARRSVPIPTPRASLEASVGYTSPKGQNSYTRRIQWDFEQLRSGLFAAQETRERQSTTQFLHARERSLMSHRLRTDILRRDGGRCRLCGASALDGITLHVDHIIPVSLGGLTAPDNLQALCQSCNLGKSNRFVG